MRKENSGAAHPSKALDVATFAVAFSAAIKPTRTVPEAGDASAATTQIELPSGEERGILESCWIGRTRKCVLEVGADAV
jgi:hypothetical protein